MILQSKLFRRNTTDKRERILSKCPLKSGGENNAAVFNVNNQFQEHVFFVGTLNNAFWKSVVFVMKDLLANRTNSATITECSENVHRKQNTLIKRWYQTNKQNIKNSKKEWSPTLSDSTQMLQKTVNHLQANYLNCDKSILLSRILPQKTHHNNLVDIMASHQLNSNSESAVAGHPCRVLAWASTKLFPHALDPEQRVQANFILKPDSGRDIWFLSKCD